MRTTYTTKSNAIFRKRVARSMGFFSKLFGGGTQVAGYGNWFYL